MNFEKADKEFKDILFFSPRTFKDGRGEFSIPFEIKTFQRYVGDCTIVQENYSISKRGVVRGLHYQIQHPQGKLISVDYGSIIDVAVDIRKSSKNFGKCFSTIMNPGKYVWIPPGYAHGFYSITPETKMVYKCTDQYSPKDERAILYCDPDLKIDWPMSPGEITVSDKDLAAPRLKDAEVYE